MRNPNDPLQPDNAPNPPTTPVRTKDMDSVLPPGADAEDRFNEFIRTNATSIFSAIAIGAVIVIGMQAWRYYQQRVEEGTRADFAQAATSNAALLAFAQDHADHNLSGVAYMEVANKDYEAGDYIQAAEHYRMAVEHLQGNPLAGRASMGAAMATLLAGDTAAGTETLRSILNNPAYQNTTRTEAGHALAVYYWEQQDWTAMREVVDTVLTFDESLPYRQMTDSIRKRIPELQ